MSKDNNKTSDTSSTNYNGRSSIYQLFGVKKSNYEQKIKSEDKKKIVYIKSDDVEQENYIKINTKNQFEIYNSEESKKKLNEILNYIEELVEEDSNEEMSQNFLDKLFPKGKRVAFIISKLISKKINKKISKRIVGEKLDFFFQNRIEFRYSKKLILTKENINNIGYILCYSYSKFEDLNINSKKDLKNFISHSDKIDVLNDFFSYCNAKGKSPQDMDILNFLEKKDIKDYLLPGAFLFLICCFDYINILELDMNVINECRQMNKEDFYLFIITILNIHYLVTKTDRFKINFNNEKFQNDIYTFFDKELTSIYKYQNRDLKKIKIFQKKIFIRKDGISKPIIY